MSSLPPLAIPTPPITGFYDPFNPSTLNPILPPLPKRQVTRSLRKLENEVERFQKHLNFNHFSLWDTNNPCVITASIRKGNVFKTYSAARHPHDPHYPDFNDLFPGVLNPYPSFEGWFTRIVNPSTSESFGVILATNYATNESQVTLIASNLKKKEENSHCTDNLIQKPTVVAQITKDAYWTLLELKEKETEGEGKEEEELQNNSNNNSLLPSFQWEAENIGLIRVDEEGTFLDVSVKEFSFQAKLTNQMPWDSENSFTGPEGWAQSIRFLPTHWFVRSLSSSATFRFHDPKTNTMNQGSGFGHEEKNWGQEFPSGHVWAQAFSEDNSAQVVISGAVFKSGPLTSPYVFAGAYRSPNLSLDFRSNDLGTFFTDHIIDGNNGKFSVRVTTPNAVLRINAEAEPNSFSEPILAPTSKKVWSEACRESYCAKVTVAVYKAGVIGSLMSNDLIDSKDFKFAALEFGEDTLS